MMRYIEINRFFLSFWDIVELLSNRNKILFGIGSLLVVLFCLCWKFLPVSIKIGKRSKWIYRLMPIVGVILIIISMWMGDGSGWGFGTGTQNPNPTEISTPDNPIKADEIIIDNTIVLRVSGKKVCIGNVECDNKESLQSILNQFYDEGIKVRIIDEFAEYKTYLWVKEAVINVTSYFEEEMK